MLKERDEVIKRVMLFLDVSLISLSFFLTFVLRANFAHIYRLNLLPSMHVFKPPSLNINDYLAVYFILLFLWCAAFVFNGMYRHAHIRSLIDVSWIVLRSMFWVTLAFSVLVFALKLKFVSRVFFAVFMVLAAGAVLLGKMAVFAMMRRSLKKGYNYKNLLIVGTGRRAVHLIEAIKAHPERGYRVVKVVDYASCPAAGGQEIPGCEVVGGEDDMLRILHSHPIDEVIFVVPRSRLDLVEQYFYVCENEGVDAAIAADLFNLKSSRLHHTDFDGIPLIALEKTFDKEWQLFVKRAVDVLVPGAGIVLLGPLFLVVMMLVKCTSSGPVFFTQRRVSLHGRVFMMYKFRSMREGAEKEQEKLAPLNNMEGPVFKIKDDPRVTPVGRFLRRFSLDELPQLFNVFVGRMSLVGPRPALASEVQKYAPWQRRRLSMRPGITCLWQAYHRDEKDFEKWMQSDLDYLDHWSLGLDFKIFIKTCVAVIGGRGAY